MDWAAGIERNRQALKRVVAALVAMAGLADVLVGLAPGLGHAAASNTVGAAGLVAGALPEAGRPVLTRQLYRAVLRLLRPAEAAARRLIIAAARDLVVAMSAPRPRKPAPISIIVRAGVGTGIVLPAAASRPPFNPLQKGERFATLGAFPSPLSAQTTGRAIPMPGLPLFDTLSRPAFQRRPASGGVPRIGLAGISVPYPVPARRTPQPFDRVDAVRLVSRVAALSAVLDDLPRHALRFARWRASRLRDPGPGVARGPAPVRRVWPLKPGRPPGLPLALPTIAHPGHAVHDALAATHDLALDVLAVRDTS